MLSIIILTNNRLAPLKNCINSIFQNTENTFEVIVVNNASTDDTSNYISNLRKVHNNLLLINTKENLGVIARNLGIEIAKGEYIAQIDDDVVVLSDWDKEVLKYFEDPIIGAVGQQGGIIKSWLDLNVYEHKNLEVDFLTGFFFVFKNIGLKYDKKFGKFWHEELWLSLKFKEIGYKLKMISKKVCSHYSLRSGPIDWDLHNRNLNYIFEEWRGRIKELDLVGMRND